MKPNLITQEKEEQKVKKHAFVLEAFFVTRSNHKSVRSNERYKHTIKLNNKRGSCYCYIS